jgi:hypothetical protein
MKTNFKQIDFPSDILFLTEKPETATGWDFAWRYTNIISGFQIGMTMPKETPARPPGRRDQLLRPSIFVAVLLPDVYNHHNPRHRPSPHELLLPRRCVLSLSICSSPYLVDHISSHVAFLICPAVSVFLVMSYLRLVVDVRFAVIKAGSARLIYLVLFSYAFFVKGFSALTVTIACIVTRFVVFSIALYPGG